MLLDAHTTAIVNIILIDIEKRRAELYLIEEHNIINDKYSETIGLYADNRNNKKTIVIPAPIHNLL